MIIDIHVHPRLDRQPMATAERLMRRGKAHGIGYQLLLGDVLRFGFDPDPAQIQQINTLTLDLVKRWPGYFSGLCFLNPAHSRDFLESEMARCLDHPGMHGVKLEASVNARDVRLDPIMEELARRRAFLLHHSWYKSVGRVAQESTPADVADLASRWPEVRIVMAHVTAAGCRGVQDVKPWPNVLVDTSGSQPVAGVMEYAVAELGSDRLLYGSDAPGRDYAVQLARVQTASLTPEALSRVLYGNAAHLLGISC